VEHHNIERVTSNEDCIDILCVVIVPEDDCIEVPPPSVQRSICESVAAQAPVDIAFHVDEECGVIREICADVAKVLHDGFLVQVLAALYSILHQ
jgi:hypothetical protein